tara:strand:- start:9 stop:479 length:471 start_codon:yes stop_codon:yes gene_type:complete
MVSGMRIALVVFLLLLAISFTVYVYRKPSLGFMTNGVRAAKTKTSYKFWLKKGTDFSTASVKLIGAEPGGDDFKYKTMTYIKSLVSDRPDYILVQEIGEKKTPDEHYVKILTFGNADTIFKISTTKPYVEADWPGSPQTDKAKSIYTVYESTIRRK